MWLHCLPVRQAMCSCNLSSLTNKSTTTFPVLRHYYGKPWRGRSKIPVYFSCTFLHHSLSGTEFSWYFFLTHTVINIKTSHMINKNSALFSYTPWKNRFWLSITTSVWSAANPAGSAESQVRPRRPLRRDCYRCWNKMFVRIFCISYFPFNSTMSASPTHLLLLVKIHNTGQAVHTSPWEDHCWESIVKNVKQI